jgi:hypothetical protein
VAPAAPSVQSAKALALAGALGLPLQTALADTQEPVTCHTPPSVQRAVRAEPAGEGWKPAAQVVVQALLVLSSLHLGFQGLALAMAGGVWVQRTTGWAPAVQAAPAEAMGPPVELVPVEIRHSRSSSSGSSSTSGEYSADAFAAGAQAAAD